jgi:chemotaxis protein CheC
MDFTDVDFDVIKEIGNIILNCIIGEIGNNLDMSLKYTLPEVQVFDKINLDKDMNDGEYNSVIILYITFSIDNTEIEGAILVNLTLNSLNELMKILGSVEVELNG